MIVFGDKQLLVYIKIGSIHSWPFSICVGLVASRDEVLGASDFRDVLGTASPTEGAGSAPGARMRPHGHHGQNNGRL